MNKKEHWEKVFSGKAVNEVSWYQQTPKESLDFIMQQGLPKTAAIIDIGGGDSFLVDHLLQMGYSNISVLDISAMAIEKAKLRLGKNAAKVNWIVSDILEFSSSGEFDCWHDRAAFHFLTTEQEISNYLSIAQQHIKPGGRLIIGTFSTSGPEKCSGLPVKQYSENILSLILQHWFRKIKCITMDHLTPFKTLQNFLFCSFQKINISNGHS
jgi:2-polyprenyl-3-methyl-5-hydroxy-6-metoxy-1,4-benzoquinol methylase